MADNYFVASESYRQIYRHGAFRGDPSFSRLLPLIWEKVSQSFKSCKTVIQPEFYLEKSRGDEGKARLCFPGVEGDCLPWRGLRHDGRGWRTLNWYITLLYLLFMSCSQGYYLDPFPVGKGMKSPQPWAWFWQTEACQFWHIVAWLYKECKSKVMTLHVLFSRNFGFCSQRPSWISARKSLLWKTIDILTDWKMVSYDV